MHTLCMASIYYTDIYLYFGKMCLAALWLTDGKEGTLEEEKLVRKLFQ